MGTLQGEAVTVLVGNMGLLIKEGWTPVSFILCTLCGVQRITHVKMRKRTVVVECHASL